MKHRNIMKVSGCLILLFLMTFIGGCSASSNVPKKAPLQTALLRVGKADAIVVWSGRHARLIDTGEEDDGEEVVDFLNCHSITDIDAMIITHFDQDHVGGADTVLKEMNVKDIYVPDYKGDHMEYTDFLTAVSNSDASMHRLSETVSFPFSDADVLIEPPDSYQVENENCDYDNNFSLITTITHGQNRLVFMGDAEKQRINEWLKGDSARKCNFLKVPHHGIYNTALEQLFKKLDPDISVICSSKKNPADTKTTELLHVYCPHVYETKDGDMLIISDGKHLESSQKIKR